jgi:hypothetical protein
MHHQTLSPQYKQRDIKTITRIALNNGEIKSAKTDLKMKEKTFKLQGSFILKHRTRDFFNYHSSLF